MKILIVANWKMNPGSLAEAKKIFARVKNLGAIICPPSIYLAALRANGSQNCFWKEGGAYTGEISPLMLKNLGVEYVIIGHSERRKYQKEDDEMINRKLKLVLIKKLKPILCIDRISQIKKNLKGIPRKDFKNLIVAYEPLFAIGTGRACSLVKAKKMRILIQRSLGQNTKVLYGGSVNSQNAKDYIKKSGFQGLLVGGASLRPKEFVDIIKKVC